MLNSYHSYSF